MATQTTVKPDIIKTLAEFVARYEKAANLGFDPETREPTIYADAKRTTKVRSIPWKREADALTVLAQPARFSALVVDAATSRLSEIRAQGTGASRDREQQLLIAERGVLDAWRSYNTATDAVKPSLRRDILAAEQRFETLQTSLASPSRILIEFKKPQYKSNSTGIYIPPMPLAMRGIRPTAAAATAAAAEEGAED